MATRSWEETLQLRRFTFRIYHQGKSPTRPKALAASLQFSSIAAESIGDLLDDKIADLKALYYSGPNGPGEFWDKLLNEVDRYSVRQFLGLE